MGKKLLKTLLAFVLLLNYNELYATHVVGGTMEYVRLGPGALPNSSRYKLVLRLWKDAAPGSNATFPSSVLIECRGDTLGYTAAGFDDITSMGSGVYPYAGLQRMVNTTVGITNANYITRAAPQFIRDFTISHSGNYLDTLTVGTGAISSTNSNSNTKLASNTGVPGYENPLYVRSSYPSAQYMKNGYGFVNGFVTVSGVNYGDYTDGTTVDYTKVCSQGRLCVPAFVDSCTLAPSIYIQYVEFIRVVDLPNIPGGYHVRYTFAARNNNLLNLVSAANGGSNQGYSVYARIPDIAQLDNTIHYIASSVSGFWMSGMGAKPLTFTGYSSGFINNLGTSPAMATIVGIGPFSRPVYTAYNTTLAGASVPANFTVVGVPASLKQLYIDLGVGILTGTGINNISTGPTVIASGLPANVIERVRNSSPKYKSVPPLFVCSYNAAAEAVLNGSGKSQNGVYQHSATDYDNDYMEYSFTTPYDGEVSQTKDAPFIGTWSKGTTNVNGTVFNTGDPLYATVPYGIYPQDVNIATHNYVKYYGSYTYDQPLGTNASLGTPGLILNTLTGDLTIKPSVTTGLYVVSIKAREFRRMDDGSKRFLGEITRDYQFNVLNCPLPAQALTTTTGSCSTGNVTLSNSSTDAATIFYWDSGKDRYLMTTTGGVSSQQRIWLNNSSINSDAQQITTNISNQTRTIVAGSLTPKLDQTFNFSAPGTYFVKLVVQGRGSKCADSVYQAVVISSVKAGWSQTKTGTICVNSDVEFSPYVVSTVNGVTTVSGTSLWTDPATNPIPMKPTVSGFVNYKWMDGSSIATTSTPPWYATPQQSKITHVKWDFGDGTIQEFTLSGTSFVTYPIGSSLKSGVTLSTITGPLSVPGVKYKYQTSGTFSVTQTVENQFSCASSLTRAITVIQAQPTASVIGANVCQNNPVVTVSGFITVATGGIWSGGTGGYLPSATMAGTSLYLQYKPTAAEVLTSGSVIPIKLTTNGNGVCQAGISSTTAGITVLPKPVVVAGNSFTVCGNNLSYTLSGSISGGSTTGQWKTKGTGTFVGSNLTTTTILGDTYVFSKADSIAGSVKLILTSLNNGLCTAVSDSIKLTVGATASLPKANAGADFTVCSNNAKAVLSGTVTNSSLGGILSTLGSGTFGPGNTLTTQTISGSNAYYTPSPTDTVNGSVKLVLQTYVPVVTNGGCKSVSDTVKVTILPSPRLNIVIASTHPTIATNACANNAVFTFTGTISGAGGGVWQMSNELSSGTFIPSASPSVVSIGANIYRSTVIYIPSVLDTKQANPVLLGVSLVSTVNGYCSPASLSKIIVLIPSPSVTISGASSIAVCKNNANIKLGSNVSNAQNFTWTSSSSGSFSPTNSSISPTYLSSSIDTSNGSVRIVLAGTSLSNNCKPAYDTLNVTYTNLPQVNPGSDQTVCENNLIAQLNGSVTTPASGGIWSTTGTGVFQSTGTKTSNTLSDIYQPSLTDLSNGAVALGLTTTGSNIGTATGQCLPVSRVSTIYFSAKPSITFGTVGAVNENNVSSGVDLTVTVTGSNVTSSTFATWGGGGGTYTPNKTNFTYYSSSPLGPILIGTLNYIPSAGEISAKQVSLFVSVTGANNCAPVSNTLIFSIYPKPTATIFNKAVLTSSGVCANNSLISLTSTVTGAAGGTWSGGTNPVIYSAPGFTATYTPTSAEITAGFVKLYFTTTGEYNNASPERDSVRVVIKPSPVVKTGGNIVLCGNGSSTTITGTVTNAGGGLWTTSGTGAFSPASIAGTVMNSTYTPSAADKASVTPIKLTLTSVGNGGCIAVNDVMNLSFSSSPTANAGPDQVVCVNDLPIQLNASGSSGSWSSSRSGGTFSSTGNATSSSLSDSYMPTTVPGVITLTWTTGGSCPSVSNSMVVTVMSAPTVNVGPTLPVCGSNRNVSVNATITGATGGTWRTNGSGNFKSTNSQIGNTPNDIYVLSTNDISNGTVTLTFTGSGTSPCSPVSATKIINITPDITALAGGDQTFCASITNITLAGQILSNGNVSTVLGGVWATVSTNGGNFISSKSIPGAVFQPSNADLNNAPRKIALSYTPNSVSSCSFKPDTVVYTFTPVPTASILGGSFAICSDAGSIALNATYTGAAGITWSTSGTNLAANWSLVNTDPSVQYVYTQSDVNTGKVSFRVQTNGSGVCSSVFSNTITVTISGKPTVTAGPDLNVCSNNSIFTLTGANVTSTGAAFSAYWFSSSSTATGGTFNNNTIIGINNNPVYTPSASEIAGGTITLFVSITGPGSCQSQLAKRVITFTPAPTVNISSPVQAFCANTPVLTLTGTTTVSASGRWTITTPGATGTLTGVASTSATYKLSAADGNLSVLGFVFTTTASGCNAVSGTKTISLTPAPTVTILGSKTMTICGDALSVTLTATSAVTGAGLWSSNSSGGAFSLNNASLPKVVFAPLGSDITNAYTNNTPIKVYLTSDNNGVCSPAKDSVSVFYSKPPTISAGSDTLVCANASIISLTGIKLSNIAGIQWSTSANSTLTGGMGTFAGSNANTSTITGESYRPGALEKAAGSTTLTLISTSYTPAGNVCQTVSAKKIITFQKAPVINSIPDQTVCANNSTINCNAVATDYSKIYWKRQGTGLFYDSTVTSTQYYPSAADLVTGATTGIIITFFAEGNTPCSVTSQSFKVKVTNSPTLTASIPSSVCADAGLVNFSSLLGGLTTTGVSWTNISSPGTLSGSFFANRFVLNPQYSPSTSDINKGFATFNVSTTGNGNCKAKDTTVQMSILPQPTIVVPANQVYCSNYAGVINLVFTGTGFTKGKWVSNGDGQFSQDSSTSGTVIQYTPSSDDKNLRKKVTFIVTSTDQGLCQPVSGMFTVSFTGVPIVSAGIAQNYCSDIGVITLSGSIAGTESYMYRWNLKQGASTGGFLSNTLTGITTTANLTNTYTLGAIDSYKNDPKFTFSLLVTALGICTGDYSQDVSINIEPRPELSITPSALSFCEDATKFDLSASVTTYVSFSSVGLIWSGMQNGGSTLAASQFSPSVFDNNVSFYPSAADRTVSGITFVVSTTGNSLCGIQTTTVGISIIKKPVVSVSGTSLVCSNQPLVSVTGFSNSGTGIWKTNSSAANTGTFTGSSYPGSISGTSNTIFEYHISKRDIDNGLVQLIYTSDNNGTCSSSSTSLGITINTAPKVDAGSSITVCTAVGITLSGTVFAPVTVAGGGVGWSLGSSSSGSIVALPNTINNNTQNVKAIFTASGGASAQLILSASLPGCNVETSSITLTYQQFSILDPGTYTGSVCTSDVFRLAPGTGSSQGVWSTTASGYFLSSGTTSTTKMDDVFKPDNTVSGTVFFVLSSLPGAGLCGAPTPKSVAVNFTNGMKADAGTSLFVSVCRGFNPVFTGTVTGSNVAQWFTNGTGTFTSSGTSFGNNTYTTLPGGLFAFTDQYIPSEEDKQNGKVVIGIIASTSGSNFCSADVQDTLTILFTDKPKAISKGYSRQCGNVSIQDGVTITGVVRLLTPNDVSALTVHDNAARWRLMRPTTLGTNFGFVSTSTGNSTALGFNFDPYSLTSSFSSYTSTSTTGFIELTIGAVYRPTSYDTLRQKLGDTLSVVIESAQVIPGTNTTTFTGTNYCDRALDTLKIVFDKSPTAVILSNSILGICADQDTFSLRGSISLAQGNVWSTTGVGSFIPGATALNKVIYKLDASEKSKNTVYPILFNYSSTGNGSCYPATNNFVLTVNVSPKPDISAGSDLTICADYPIITLAGINTVTVTGAIPTAYKWTTNGLGTFAGFNSVTSVAGLKDLSGIYTIAQTDISFGNIQFTLSTTGPAGCKDLTKTINLNINPLPSIVPSPGIQTCNDIDDISLSVTTQNVSTVQWAVLINGVLSTPGVGTFTGSNGSTGISSIAGDGITNINYKLTSNDRSADSLVFYISSLGTLPGSSNPACNPITKKIAVYFTPRPVVSLSSIAGICSNALAFNLNGTIAGGALGGLWTSSSSDGIFTPDNSPLASNIQTAGYTYNLSENDRSKSMIAITLTATDIGTCTKSYATTQNVNIVQLPKVSAGGDTTVCSDVNTITFTLSTQTGAASIAWKSFGTGTFSGINNTLPGAWLYTPTQADSAAGQVSFELIATGFSPCGLDTAFRIVKFDRTPKISISAGLDQVVCSDNTLINLNGFTDGSSYVWSVSKPLTVAGTNQQFNSPSTGRGVFRNGTNEFASVDTNSTLNPSYFPSLEDTLGANRNNSNQVVKVTLKAYGNGSCSSQAYYSSMNVTFTPRPNVYLQTVQPICDSDKRPVTILGFFLNTVAGSGLWSSTGDGQFTPSTSVSYSPTVVGVYYPSDKDRLIDRRVGIRLQPQDMGTCKNPLTDPAISLIFITSPGINAGIDRTVCENINVVSFSGFVTGLKNAQWKSSGTGIFNSNLTNPGNNLTITGTAANDIYQPSGIDKLAGKVNLFLKSLVTVNNCPLDSAKVSLSFDKIPVVTVGLDKYVCSDIDVVSLTGTVTNVSGGYWTALSPASGSFVPSGTLLGTTYKLSTGDRSLQGIQFTLTSGSNQCQPVTSSPLTYLISPLPVVNSGNPSICTIDGIQLSGKVLNTLYAYWGTSGTGTFSPSIYDTTARYYPSQADKIAKNVTLTLTATGLAGCGPVSSSVTLNVGDNPIPEANAGSDDLVCKDGIFKLNVNGTKDPTYTYTWFTGSFTGSGEQLVALAQPNEVNVNVQLYKDSIFVLQVINNTNKCVNTDSINIRVITLPALNLVPRVCFNDTLILPVNQLIPITKTEGTYQWYKNGLFVQGETSPKRIKATSSGDYTLEYTEYSCSTRDTTNVRPLPIVNTLGKVICIGNETMLTPTISTIAGINTGLYAVDWALAYNVSVNGFDLTPPQDAQYHQKTIKVVESRTSGKYLVAVIDTLYGLQCTAYDTVRIQTHPKPLMQLKDVSACNGDAVTLDAEPSNMETPKIFSYPPSLYTSTVNASFSWQSIPSGLVKSPTSPKITVNSDGSGTYIATFTIGECIAKDTSNVLYNASPVVNNQSITKYCFDDKTGIVLDAGAGTDYKYLWLASGNTGRTETVYDTLTYYVKIFNKAGCSVLDSIEVKSSCAPKVYIPGAFKPDETCATLDGCDKYFIIRGKYFKSIKIKIFNRWGEIIYSSESKDFAWDGTYNGTPQPLGVYPYVFEYESIYDDQKGLQTRHGSVTLVR